MESPVVFNVIRTEISGGLKTAFEQYHKMVSHLGYHVISIGLKSPFTKKSLLHFDHQIPSSGHYSLVGMASLLPLLFYYRPTYAICHCSRSANLLSFYRRWIKTIGITHSQKMKYFKNMEKMVALSQSMTDLLNAADYKGEIVEIPLSIPTPTASFKAVNSYEEIKLGFLGRLEPSKGVNILIEALSYLPHSTTLIVGGSGKQLELVKEKQRVMYLGEVICIDSFFSKIDLFCIASAYETFGFTIFEAWARKRLVIMYRFRYFPASRLKHRINCLIVEERTPVAFAKMIKWCIAHPQVCEEIIERAYQNYLEEFTEEAVEKKLISLF